MEPLAEGQAAALNGAPQAEAAGQDGSRFQTLGDNLMRAAERSREEAAALAADSLQILLIRLAMLVAIRVAQGLWANRALERK
jgi:glycine betaine/proline transport system permease protein